MDRKSATAATAGAVGALGLSGSLLMWVVNQQTVTEAAHAKAHQEMAVEIAKLQARLDFHHGEPTSPERAVEAAAEAAVEEQKP